MSLGSRGGDLMRIVARDRYVNGLNGEFLCIKGRFGHPFVNHEDRIRTPLIRYKEGGRLVAATWDEAIRFAAENLASIKQAHGPGSIGVLGSPRITNEALYCLKKIATDVIGTGNYAVSDAYSLKPFFENLGGPLATHRDIRYAKTIVLIGGEPEELQPLTAKQIRQAVRNGGAKLVLINSVRIRLRESASQFIHIRPGTEDAAVLALANAGDSQLAAQKMGVETAELDDVRKVVSETEGDVVVMFGGELSSEALGVAAQLPYQFAGEGRRVLLHPLPLYNNSVGAHDMMAGAKDAGEVLRNESIRALIMAGKPVVPGGDDDDVVPNHEFAVLFELFLSAVSSFERQVVFPAASFAEVDGTFTNNDGFVQRVRKSIEPVHQAKPDWLIAVQLASALGVDFDCEMSASGIFREIGERVPAYTGLRYPLLKDETQPVQVKYEIAAQRDVSAELSVIRKRVEAMEEKVEKNQLTPAVGHELFKLGTLTEKVPQFHLLAAGNPKPETVSISPLYQITVDEELKREPVEV
jgi:NADH-quinone oxidoreductase subunit G